MPVTERPVFAVTGDQRFKRQIIEWFTTYKIQRCRDLKQVPAESGIVKVDKPDDITIDQKVFRRKVRVNQAVSLSVL